jgi:hypothetical protein
MSKRKAVPVTIRALIQRINRKLEQNDQRLRTARGSDLGRYYILDFKHNSVVKRHVDPEALGRDFGVLKDYELLAGSWSYPNT